MVTLGDYTAGNLGAITLASTSSELSYLAPMGVTVSGVAVETVGLVPEQSVDFSLDESRASDPQFDAAVSTLMASM